MSDRTSNQIGMFDDYLREIGDATEDIGTIHTLIKMGMMTYAYELLGENVEYVELENSPFPQPKALDPLYFNDPEIHRKIYEFSEGLISDVESKGYALPENLISTIKDAYKEVTGKNFDEI